MFIKQKTMIVLGGSGFIGQRVIEEAVKNGWRVKALARSEKAATSVANAGAEVLTGDAQNAKQWLRVAVGAEAIIDLFQPARPKRVGRKQMREISRSRQLYTRALVDGLLTLDPASRPKLICVSGIDDLAPDRDGVLSAHSNLNPKESGFNSVGIPVRKIIETSGLVASFAYLGTVYGNGGPFGTVILPAIAAGRWKNFGQAADRMIMVHVDDVANGLVRISGLDPTSGANQSFVLTDDQPVTMFEFCGLAAKLMRVSAPGTIPKWLAALVAGKPIVETTLHKQVATASFPNRSTHNLLYPSFHEGLPATLKLMGFASAVA